MKPPVLLKTILDICFYILLFSTIIAFGATMYDAIFPENSFDWNIKIQDYTITEFTAGIYFLFTYAVILAILFITCIYYLRKLVQNFMENEIFSTKQTSYLAKIGKLIIIVSVAEIFLPILSDIILGDTLSVNISAERTFGSFWFTLAIGLFFLYLSQVFENARKLKEENDYTV